MNPDIECCSIIFPFNSLSSNKTFLASCANIDSILQWKDLKIDQNSSVLLNPTSNLELFVNRPEYYSIDKMHNIKIPNKNKSMSLFPINVFSLNKYFDDLQHLLSYIENNFHIIAITETKITKQVSLSNNLNLNNFFHEFTPMETSAGDTLPCIVNHISYKYYNDLNIYNKNELELCLMKSSTLKNQMLLWESLSDIPLWILLFLIAIS